MTCTIAVRQCLIRLQAPQTNNGAEVIYAVDEVTGSKVWEFFTDAPIRSPGLKDEPSHSKAADFVMLPSTVAVYMDPLGSSVFLGSSSTEIVRGYQKHHVRVRGDYMRACNAPCPTVLPPQILALFRGVSG